MLTRHAGWPGCKPSSRLLSQDEARRIDDRRFSKSTGFCGRNPFKTRGGVLALLFCGAALPVVGLSAPALAQEASSNGSGAVQEVVVTAQRRSENLQEAPVSVTAISSAALTRASIATTQDLMQIVPSLQVATQTGGDGGGSATFFLRGMGQERAASGSEPAVGVYVDDFYYPSVEGDIFNIVDLADVEVLRGPQGTLFGRNTIGGAIRYTSQQPVLGSFSTHASATYGSYNRADFIGATNIPVGDSLALRLTAGHLERDGFVKEQTGGPDGGETNTNLIRLQAKYRPTSRFTADLSAMWDRFDLKGLTYDMPGPLTPVPGPSLTYLYNSVIAPARGLPLYTNALESKCFYCQPGTGPNEPEFSTTEYENVLSTLSYEVAPWLTMKSLTGYQHLDTIFAATPDGTSLGIFYTGAEKHLDTVWSQEFQFNGRALQNRLNYVSGLFYYNQHLPPFSQVTPELLLTGPGAIVTPEDRTTTSYAGYVDVTYNIIGPLTLIGGYRYSEDQKTDDVTLATGVIDDKKNFPSNTWRAGLQYQWTRDIMTYFTASTGFRSGGFNPYQAGVNGVVPFAPETVTSYEGGARIQLFDRKLTINPTVFYYDWDKIQVQSVFFVPGSAASLEVLQNAGAAIGKGFELEWNYAPTHAFNLYGNLATLSAHYTSIGNATVITLSSPLERAPPLTASVGASYQHDFGVAGNVRASMNYSYEGEQSSTPADNDALLLPAYNLLSARVEWHDQANRYTVALFGTNLTDTHYYVGGVNYYGFAGAAHYDLGRPLELGVTLGIRF